MATTSTPEQPAEAAHEPAKKSLLAEKKYTLSQAANKMGFTLRAFHDTVKPKLRLIVHNDRRIEVPESSIEEYYAQHMMLGTPATQAVATEKKRAKKSKRRAR
jgi:hypothetical protein